MRHEISADLVMEDDVSQILCEIGYGNHVRSLVVVLIGPGLLRQKLQLVLYSLQSSGAGSTGAILNGERERRTRINFSVA